MNWAGRTFWIIFGSLATLIMAGSIVLFPTEPLSVLAVDIPCAVTFVIGTITTDILIKIRKKPNDDNESRSIQEEILRMLPDIVGFAVYCLIAFLIGSSAITSFALLGFVIGPFVFDMLAMLIVTRLRTKS